MITPWDFLLLDGWDWKFVLKGPVTLNPGDEYRDRSLRMEGPLYPVGMGLMSYGHDDSKFTQLIVDFDGKTLMVSPFGLYAMVGTWTGWLPSYFFVSRFDALTDTYAIGSNPMVPVPCKNYIELRVRHPTKFLTTSITGATNVYVLLYVYRIIDEDKFIESLKKLQK